MSRPGRRGNNNAIRGPQSALTDFLASHNISAAQINAEYQTRVEQARRDAEAEAAAEVAAEQAAEEDSDDLVERKKRKRKEDKAIAKIKASKEFKKRKFQHQRDNPGEDSDSDAVARAMMKKPGGAFGKAPPKPGQFANCELCEKRFTVTAYTLAGPDGSGLLCTKCGKVQKDDQKKTDAAEKKAQKKPIAKARRRQTESDRMMGDAKLGAKSLIEHCVRKVANVVNDIEEFGDLPQSLLDRLSQILSKNRALNPRTLQLFMQPGIDRIAVYDCARLETEDFGKIFAYMPDVERVNLRMAGQFKDENLRYMAEKNPKITHLQLGASNLVTDAAWRDFLDTRGPQLKSLKLSELNDSFGDDICAVMVQNCKNLERLKLRRLDHLTDSAISHISQLTSLKHLTLRVAQHTSSETLVTLITSLGPELETLCLEQYPDMDDTVLNTIRTHCSKLNKLRLTGSAYFTDTAFTSLFTNWSNSPLTHVDLSSSREMDPSMGADSHNDNEDVDQDVDENGLDKDGNPVPQSEVPKVGFASLALPSLLSHSGQTLVTLDLHSNRHISHSSLLSCFDGVKTYPALKDVDLSFVTHIDDVIMQGIFKSCPNLNRLAVFACFSARSVRIPEGVAVVGLPGGQVEEVG